MKDYIVFEKDKSGIHYTEYNTEREALNFIRNILGSELTLYKKEKEFEKYPTLRTYINEHSRGSYHRFYFILINGIKVDGISSVDDFERYYNPKLLDEYYVTSDETKEFGSNCCDYCCEHYLSTKTKEV